MGVDNQTRIERSRADRVRADARGVATRVLHRVCAEGAYAAAALDAECRRGHLDSRDAALATQIVYGTLRTLPQIDDALSTHIKALGSVDPWTLAALRCAAYQVIYLTRVP